MKILIALPVYNEQLVLGKNVKALVDYCRKDINQYQFQIIICDNNSTDNTAHIAQELVQTYPETSYLFIKKRGKGNAWRQAFLAHDVDVYCMMDIDLATDLQSLPALLNEVIRGSDLVIGSRFLADSNINQSRLRLIISRSYIYLVNKLFRVNFTDFQCGFKAMNKRFRDGVLTHTTDNEFFLDTETILIGGQLGYILKEIPILWSDFREPQRVSSVDIISTIIHHIYKLVLLRLRY